MPSAKTSKPNQLPLDWANSNFLENLLRCVQPTRSVPRESGVCFRVSSQVKNDAICLLFHIDRKPDPLVTDREEPRPDYLCAHLSPAGLILTIIELKSRAKKNLGHGVEQIVTFFTRLRAEVREHLPSYLRVHYQGILLAKRGDNIPVDKIARASRSLIIVPLQFEDRAELLPYVSTRLELSCIYKHNALPHDDGAQFGDIEKLLSRGPDRRRRDDHLLRERFRPGKSRAGLYVNFSSAAGKGDEYLTLLGEPGDSPIILGVSGAELMKVIRSDLSRLSLRVDGRRCRLEELG